MAELSGKSKLPNLLSVLAIDLGNIAQVGAVKASLPPGRHICSPRAVLKYSKLITLPNCLIFRGFSTDDNILKVHLAS